MKEFEKNAVFGSILENLSAIELVLEPTIEAFKGDRTYTGDSREITVNNFIRSYLPSDFQVKKGKIYSLKSSSNNIDCVVLAPNHPRLITPKREVILAEGVYAAIEVKPDISVLTENSELFRALKQIESVKKLDRQTEFFTTLKKLNSPVKPDYFYKIPSVIFSFHSADIKKTVKFICEKVKEGIIYEEGIPDLIVTLDKGILFFTPYLSHTSIGNIFNKNMFLKDLYGEKIFVHWESDKKEYTLLLFLLLFLNFTPPTHLLQKFIILDYLEKIEVVVKRNVYPIGISEKASLDLNVILKSLAKENRKKIENIQPDMVKMLKEILDSNWSNDFKINEENLKLYKKLFECK